MAPMGAALLLGLLQGVTWVFPVSASGHTALAALLFGLASKWPALDFLVQVGVLLATGIVLRAPLGAMSWECLRAFREPRRLLTTTGGRDLLAVVLASVPTALLGLALFGTIHPWTSSPLVVGVGLATTTFVLLSTQWVARGQVELPGWGAVILIGMAQGLAFLPGVSRSAVVISLALWFGIRRDRAFELAMLLSLPIVLGGIALSLRAALAAPQPWGLALLGGAAALVSAFLALRSLRKVVETPWFPWFALWVGPLAIATLALAKAWPGR